MNLEPRWWGPILGVLHSYESLVDHQGFTLARTAERAACGVRPPGGVLECPEELLASDKLCHICQQAVETKACECCAGAGTVEVCPNGHTGASCPCSSVHVDCPDCDGSGREELEEAPRARSGQ